MRERILAAATRLFAARGFDGTALQDIADAVGVRKPSVLHHFPSKEALREGVLQAMLGHFGEVLPRILLAASGGRRLRSLMEELCSFFLADPDRARVLMREVLDRPAEVQALLHSGVRPFVDAIALHIQEEQDRGAAPKALDPQAYLLHVLRMVISTIATLDTFGVLLRGPRAATDRQLQELLRIAEESLFPGLQAAPGTAGLPTAALPPSRPAALDTARKPKTRT